MDILAVVPASSSFSRRAIGSRPLAIHALEQARAARHVTRVAIVTADADLRRLAEERGADTVQPPDSNDRADLLRAALEQLDGFAPALAVVLDPAYPLRSAETIDGAIDQLWRCGADSLVSVRLLSTPLWTRDEGGLARPIDRGPTERRYAEVGTLACVRVGVFEQTGELPSGRVVLHEVPAVAALRLEDDADWHDTELLVRQAASAHGRALLRKVALLVFDFDGVMTDNRVLVFDDGREAVLCNRGDGMGLDMLRSAGVPLAVISKEISPVVGARCRKLKIPYHQGIEDKIGVLKRLLDEQGLSFDRIAYMGNDVNDIECMSAAGVAIAPVDAHPHALRAADLVTAAAGGFGAVREVCDLLLAIRSDDAEPAGVVL